MRARFLLPGIALAAFAATLTLTAWPDHELAQWQAAALPRRVVLPAEPANSTLQDSAAQARDDASSEARQTLLPDPSSLPSYESDQAARNANPLRSARTR
jgi:hypothetical protein